MVVIVVGVGVSVGVDLGVGLDVGRVSGDVAVLDVGRVIGDVAVEVTGWSVIFSRDMPPWCLASEFVVANLHAWAKSGVSASCGPCTLADES